MSRLKEDLVKVRAKVEAGWCQGAFARNSEDRTVSPYDDTAVSFCVVGATQAVLRHFHAENLVLIELWYELCRTNNRVGLAHFNDAPGRTKEDILALIDGAIAHTEDA